MNEDILSLLQALEFYAAEHNWNRGYNQYSNHPENSEIMNDCGDLARKAIEKFKAKVEDDSSTPS